MRAALYARVSTERQERQQTIDSQLTALRSWVAAQGHSLAETHVFRDEGYSGARLDRPGLDGLRDAVRDAAVDVVAVLSPDRLARKYAYQVLLLEEFRRAGREVVFLQHPISEDPNDQLLLQIQGAIAEYERAVLAERFRRGKLQKARDGHVLSARPPYGYRYVPRQDGRPAHLVIDEAEAPMVRQLYTWLIEEHLTLRQILKRLNAGPWVPRSGRRPWSPSVAHHILSDPVYAGTAYANRYEYVAPKKPRVRSPCAGERSCRRPKPKEQWIAIPAPALIDAERWDQAQAQLARNARLSFRHNIKHRYLLRCLLTCSTCGLAMHGHGHGLAGKPGRRYYQCAGKDPIMAARSAPCPRARIPAEELERVVWDHVAALLADPAQLVAQFEHFVAEAGSGSAQEQAHEHQFQARLERIARADRRLLDAYQAEIISLSELSERRSLLAEQRCALEQQHEERQRLRQQQARAQEALASLTAFCVRVRSRLQDATFADQQAILQLVIERIIVGEGSLEIRHVIPLRHPPAGSDRPPSPEPRLCSDGVKLAALPRHAGKDGEASGVQPLVRVADEERDPAQAAPLQALQKGAPVRFRLGQGH